MLQGEDKEICAHCVERGFMLKKTLPNVNTTQRLVEYGMWDFFVVPENT